MSFIKKQRTWEQCNFIWSNPPYPFTWDDVYLLIEVADIVMGRTTEEWDKWQKREEEKKKRLIKLICIVKGEKFEESKYSKDVKINVKDVKMLIERALSKKAIVSFDKCGEK